MGSFVRVTLTALPMLALLVTGISSSPHASQADRASRANPYNLVTEDRFTVLYDTKVVPYWTTYGRTGEFTGKDGVPIRYMTFTRNDEKGAVVVSSGRTEGLIKYQELIYDIGRQGYSIYIHDHRGQGFSGRMTSDREMGYVDSFDDYVDDLKTFVDSVVKQKKHERLFLLAHSMGGAIASLYVERYPDDFTAAILSSPMHKLNAGAWGAEVGCASQILEGLLTGMKEYATKKGPYDDPRDFQEGQKHCCTHSKVRYQRVWDSYAKHPEARLGGPSKGWVKAACFGERRARKDADQIRIPVLVLQAGADSVVLAEGQNEFCQNLNRAKPGYCRLEPIAGAYHELFVESDVYRTPALTKILEFMAEQSK